MREKIIFTIMFALMFISVATAYTDSVTIEDDYNLEINYDSAISGNYFNLEVTITNYADSAKDFTIKFDDDDPFDFKTDEEWAITNLASEDSDSKTFRIEIDEDAESKSYDLEFNLDDGDDDWDDEFSIKVSSDSAEISLASITSYPTKLYPNTDDVTLSVTIKNKGDKTAEDLVATIILPEDFEDSSSYANTIHFGDLYSEVPGVLTFYFDIGANVEELSEAQIKLDYEVDGEEETSYLDLEIPVFPIPQFEITNTEILNDKISAGSTSKVKFTIANVGNENAEDVTLKVYERSDQPFTFEEKSVYIGSLNIGETGSAIFQFDVDSDADVMDYLMDFQVRSITGNSVLVDDLTTKLTVSEKASFIKTYFIYILIGLGAIIGTIIFFIRRRS